MSIDKCVKYDGFNVYLSDMDRNKLDKAWKGASKHWTCIVKDPVNRKQMSFDVFGGSNATMHPLEAFYLYVDDAYTYSTLANIEDLMLEFGYDSYREAKKIWLSLEKAYYKCRKFIGTDDDIYEIVSELREKWG